MKLLFIFLILKLIKYTIFRNVKVCFSYYIVIQEFPKKNKYVNLGESLLITGGLTKNNVISNKCYLFSYNQNNTFDITSFPEIIKFSGVTETGNILLGKLFLHKFKTSLTVLDLLFPKFLTSFSSKG